MILQLYIKNIPFAADTDSLSEALSSELNAHPDQTKTAKIGSLSLPENRERGGIAGFGFVSILTGSLDEEQTIECLFGLDLDGRKLHVEKYVPKERR